MNDNINVDMNNKTADADKAVRSENVEGKLEALVYENVVKTKDVEMSSKPIEVDDYSIY